MKAPEFLPGQLVMANTNRDTLKPWELATVHKALFVWKTKRMYRIEYKVRAHGNGVKKFYTLPEGKIKAVTQ